MSAPSCQCHSAGPAEPEGLITQRVALIVLIALVLGLVVGAVTFIAYGNVAGAILAGLGVLGLTLGGAHALIRRDN